MNRIIPILAVILSFVFSEVFAQDLNKGFKAFNAGDYATALKEWKPLAEQGNARAQHNLGVMYQEGKGVLQDYTEVLKWWLLSAEQGTSETQYNLGIMHDAGKGVLQDYAEAVKWYRLSAEQGHDGAQHNLGVMYANGNGVLKDNVTAHMWLNIASANGNKKAGANRDKRATLMTPEDISKATVMARKCMASNYKKCGY
jgi:uncharacterized protein